MKKLPLFLFLAIFSVGSSAYADPLPEVLLHTTLGDIVVEIDNVHAPITGNNFLSLVDAGSYNGGAFYRTVTSSAGPTADQIIQGGISLTAPAPATITLEKTSTTGLSNTVGTIAMARMTDPNSGSSEFYINVSDNSSRLDDGGTYGATGGYAVFGHVLSGMSVVTTIQSQPADGSQNLTPNIAIVTGVRVLGDGDGGTIEPDLGASHVDASAASDDASAPSPGDASVAPVKKSSGCSYAPGTPGSELVLIGMMLAVMVLRRRVRTL